MKLKGKTMFELTNVETGETKVVKEENMVTNALNYFMQGSGIYGGTLYNKLHQLAGSSGSYQTAMGKYNHWDDPVRCFTGGLVLFSDRLEEDENHMFLTADDPDVTGVGSDLAYIGLQTQAGSYNSVESGPIEGGYKHVWDFTTAQANGDIGCACLTTPDGAGLGFGMNKDVTDWMGHFNYFSSNQSVYAPAFDDYFTSNMAMRLGYFDEGRNLFIRMKDYYSIPSSGGSTNTGSVYNEPDINDKIVSKPLFPRTFIYKKSIDFNVYRVPFNNFSLFDKYYHRTETRYSKQSYHCPYKLLRTVTVDMPSDLAALIPDDLLESSLTTARQWPTAVQTDEGYMYISFVIPPTSFYYTTMYLESGEKIYTWRINMETFESDWFATPNTTGKRIAIDYQQNGYMATPFVTVSNNYTVLYERTDTYHAWVIDNATGATIKEVCDVDDKPINFQNIHSYLYGTLVYNDIVLYIHGGNNQTNQYMLMLNMKTGVMKYCRYSGMMGHYSYNNDNAIYGYTHGTPFPKIINCYYRNDYQYATLYINPMILMTINNLDDVVTKTSAETMKVTYILTEEEDEE